MSGETACVLAAIILADAEIEITADSIGKLVKASGVEVAPQWPILFSQFLQGKNVMDLLTSIGSGAAAAPVAGAPAAAEKQEEEKKEKTEEEEVIGGFMMDSSSSEEEDSD